MVRVAGNIPSPHVLGSIEYAVEHLGGPLIVVLGHERCGAVKATVDEFKVQRPTTPDGGLDLCVRNNVLHAVADLVKGARRGHDREI